MINDFTYDLLISIGPYTYDNIYYQARSVIK